MMKEMVMDLLVKEFPTVWTEKIPKNSKYPCDLLGENKKGESCEIEIKRSDYDFYKEFTSPRKREKHKNYRLGAVFKTHFCPTRFYYAVPSNLVKKALLRLNTTGSPYGLIEFNTRTQKTTILRKSQKLPEYFGGTP